MWRRAINNNKQLEKICIWSRARSTELARPPAVITMGCAHISDISGFCRGERPRSNNYRNFAYRPQVRDSGLGDSPRPDDYSTLAAICQVAILHKKRFVQIAQIHLSHLNFAKIKTKSLKPF